MSFFSRCFPALLAVAPFCLAADNGGPIPVIVELFTSEGCSSCPPADDLLAKLDRGQSVSGARVIALEEHVDYWNQLGWTDRFSNPIFRGRQNEYSNFFRTENIYTPQMVVAGRAQFVGDDAVRAAQEVGRAAAVAPSYGLRVIPERNADPALTDLTVYVKMLQGKPQSADVFLAVTESKLSSNVQRGENAGRTLRHAPVVRSFGVIGSIEPRRFDEVGIKSTMKFPDDWRRENLRAVVFVQDRNTHAIVAAAAIDLK
jgi:hypothetical protein